MKKNIVWGVVAVFALAGIVWFVQKGSPANESVTSNSTSTSSSTPSSTATTTKITTKDTGGSHAGLSYGSAVNIFANRRIQFDANCAATPNHLVLKNGTNVMFDNRAETGRYIALDGVRYYVRGYDFRILTLSAKRLPHTTWVDCGSGRNNASIVLE